MLNTITLKIKVSILTGQTSWYILQTSWYILQTFLVNIGQVNKACNQGW